MKIKAFFVRPCWLALLGLLILLSKPATAAPIQKVTCNFSSSSATCALPNAVQKGDLLVIALHSWSTPQVSDSLKSSWSQATALNSDSIWYAVTSAGGSDLIMIGTGGNGGLLEYSGFSALDAAASQSNAAGATAISSGSATILGSGDVVVGAMFGSGWSGAQAGTGFSIEAAFGEEATEDEVQSSAGTASATFMQPSWAGASTVLMAAFKDAPVTTSLDISAFWDDGTPVAAQVSFAQANSGTSPTILLTEALVSGISPTISAALLANTTYDVMLVCEGDISSTCANGTSLYQFPFTTVMINPSNLQSGVIGLVFRKKDLSLKSAKINVGMAF